MPGFSVGGRGGPSSMNPRDGDWLRSHRFVLVDFLGQKAINSSYIVSDSSPEFAALKDVVMPEKRMSELGIKTPGTTYKFAAQAEYSDLKMVFYGSRILLAKLYQMQDKVHNTRDGLQDYQDYKGEITFRVVSSPVSNNFSFFGINLQTPGSSGLEFCYKNAYVSEVQGGQISYTSSEIMQITVIVKFDFFEVKMFESDRAGNAIVSNKEVQQQLLSVYNGEI